MDKLKNMLFGALNFLVVVLLLCGIVFGLNKIGVFSFSDFFRELFGLPERQVNVLPHDDGKIYQSLSDGKSGEDVTVKVSLTPENVKSLLESVTLADDYYQEAQYTVFAENSQSIRRKAVIRRTDALTSISLYDEAGTLFKRIEQLEKGVRVTNISSDGNETWSEFPDGSISAEQESGVIMTHADFLDGNLSSQFDESSYSVAYSSYGTVMLITFEKSDEKYKRTQKYWLSLDYGVVVRAECYENDSLVYLLETLSLTE